MDWKTVDPDQLEAVLETDLLIADAMGLGYGPVVNAHGRTVGYHLLGKDGEVELGRPLPMYSRWIESAITLPLVYGCWKMSYTPFGSAHVMIEATARVEWREHKTLAYADTLPLAMVRSWLKWKQAQL